MTDLSTLAWVMAALGLGFGIRFVARHFSREQRLLRRLRDAPRKAIGDAVANAPVRLAGRVFADAKSPLEAPLSHRPCVAWQVLLEKRIGSNNAQGNELWRALAREDGSAPLELRDRSGSVIFYPAGSTWSLANEIVTTLQFELDGTPETRDFLARHGVRWEGYTKPVLRFREQVLEQDARISLFGCPRVEGVQPGGGSPYRDGAARMIFTAGEEQPLVISDGGGED